MDQPTKTYDASKNNNRRQNNYERKSLKPEVTKTESKSEEADDSKSVFSDVIFAVTSAPAKVQDHSALATTRTSIPKDPTIKGIYSDSVSWMQVSAAATHIAMETITIEIPKSQVSMLAKKVVTFVDQAHKS